MMKISLKNWGNYPQVDCCVSSFDTIEKAMAIVSSDRHLIARGMGRCYGDSSLGENVISTLKYNKIMAFDVEQGVIECQSGIHLDDLLKVIVPKGWFLPVTPGTKYISIGGAVASDIHGKNHHKEGSFSRYVTSLTILCDDGTIYECSNHKHAELFRASCGGMGLTGVILTVKFQLKAIICSYIRQRQIKAPDLESLLILFEEYKSYTYSVAWVDCLAKGRNFGKGILILGEHAEGLDLNEKQIDNPLKTHDQARFNIPFNFPAFTLNRHTIKLFNKAYYSKNTQLIQENVVHYDAFFYPLDNINNWNRMYGTNGFLQYQFVLPLDRISALKAIMARISNENQGSFLSVLKIFGPQKGMMSFPMEGFTLALDFPITPTVLRFLDELDKIVLLNGGRIYLTKDARMDQQIFEGSYSNLKEFQRIVHQYNPNSKFQSTQSERLSIIK